MGSATYEFVLEHDRRTTSGPTRASRPGCSARATCRGRRATDVDVRIATPTVTDLYDEMIAAAGERNLWVVGGGNVASQFADAGLLDELIVTVVPVVLGEGKPLFDRRLPGGPMQLTGTRIFDSGMVELRYEIQRPRR